MPIITSQNQAQTPEAPVSPVAPETIAASDSPEPQPNPMASQFAILARKEKMIRNQMRQMQEKEKSFQSQLDQMKSNSDSQWKQKLSQNPWDTLIESGMNPEQVAQIILNPPKSEEIELKKLKKELEEVKASQGQAKELIQKQQDLQYQQAKTQMTREVESLIQSDSSYEAIKHYGREGIESVVDLIEEVFNKGMPGKYKPGFIMPLDEAAKEVEDYLIEQFEKSFKTIKKLQSKLQPQAIVSQSVPKSRNLISQQLQPQTLSNRLVQTNSRPLTDKERRERAIAAFQGRL